MRYEELLDLLTTTTADDWVVVSPPQVDEIKVNGVDGLEIWLAGHSSVAYLRANLDVSVAWGADQQDGPWEGAWGQWSTFPDRTVHGMFAELAWHGRPVYRQLIARADGGRYYLPAPDPVMSQPPRREVERWVVKRGDLPLARLIAALTHPTQELEQILTRLNIELVD